MLNRGRDDMIAAIPVGIGDALDRQIIRLGPAAGKIDLPRSRIDKSRYLSACFLHRRTGVLPKHMDTGRITKPLLKERPHGFQHFGAYRRGSVMVEVYTSHGFNRTGDRKAAWDTRFRMQNARDSQAPRQAVSTDVKDRGNWLKCQLLMGRREQIQNGYY